MESRVVEKRKPWKSFLCSTQLSAQNNYRILAIFDDKSFSVSGNFAYSGQKRGVQDRSTGTTNTRKYTTAVKLLLEKTVETTV